MGKKAARVAGGAVGFGEIHTGKEGVVNGGEGGG